MTVFSCAVLTAVRLDHRGIPAGAERWSPAGIDSSQGLPARAVRAAVRL